MATATPAAIRRRGNAERVARAADALLELTVIGLAVWTVVYHLCLFLHLRVVWAATASVIALIPCLWLYARPGTERPAGPELRPRPRPVRALTVSALAAAAAGAVLFGLEDGPWTVVWILWLLAAIATLAVTVVRGLGREQGDGAGGEERDDAHAATAWGALAALAWSAALAVLSLFIVNPDSDDSQYVHLSAWVAAHGRFPLRDILFTDQRLPSLFFPPVSSFEGLLGTLARGVPIGVTDLVYLVVAPVAVVLAVLALWRLLRCWRVPLPGVALSVAATFLLFDYSTHYAPGAYFISRMWQGKVLFLAIVIPLAFALLHAYAERPSRRRLALLAATGTAAVGLTTTAIFAVPVMAVAWSAPTVRARPRAALAGAAALAAYPLALGAITLAVGGRNPESYVPGELAPSYLVHHALGEGVLGAIALFAVLAGPLAVPRRSAARMLAVGAVVLALVFLHPVTSLLFDVTGLGKVLWRLMWVAPVAALLGTLVVRIVPRGRPLALRLLPAVAVCAAMPIVGVPSWGAEIGGQLVAHPAWKLGPARSASAQAVLRRSPRAATVLAPQELSQALLVLSGTVTTVDPVQRYVKALDQFGGAGHVRKRRRLQRFAERSIHAPDAYWGSPEKIATALRAVGVDVACIPDRLPDNDAVLARLGWTSVGPVPGFSCRRPPA